MGGFYERLVGLVKRSLRKTIGKICLTYEQLQTIITEVQAVVNSRPLVYVGDDINSGITLTPANFLTLNPYTGIPEDETSDHDSEYQPQQTSAQKLLQTWLKCQKHLNRFWKMWRDDYLLNLRERTNTHVRGPRINALQKPKPGDIVLIRDNLPRGSWKLGRIKNMITSQDGEQRAAKVTLPSHKIINRPLKLLYPIECPQLVEEDDEPAHVDKHQKSEEQNRPQVRQAALDARKRITKQMNFI